MRNARSFLLLIALILLFTTGGYFSRIPSFSITEIPDVFSSFDPLLWLSISSFGIVLMIFSLKRLWMEVFGCILLWSLFYIMPIIVNYPLLGLNIEQLVFAKWKIGNKGWPAAYILWSMMMTMLNLDIIMGTIMLGFFISMTSIIVLLTLSRKVMKKPGYAYIATLFFILPQTYFLNFFSDYSYAFLMLLMTLYNVLPIKKSIIMGRSTFTMFLIISTSLILSNPIASMTILLFIMIYTSTWLFLKLHHTKELRTCSITYFLLLTGWYVYNHIAFSAVSPWIEAITRLMLVERALTLHSYVTLLRIPPTFFYLLLLYYRYAIFMLLGCFTLYGIYLHVKSRDKERLTFYFSFMTVCALLWFILTASTLENFSLRFMLFGIIPVALMSSYTLLALHTKLRIATLIVLSLTLPLSFALSFSPSLFNRCSHEWSFDMANFTATHIGNDTLLVSDTWGVRYVQIFNPIITHGAHLDSVTVANIAPRDVYLPQSRHLILLSLSQKMQALVSFGRPLDDWYYLDEELKSNYELIYNNYYSSAWFKR